MQKNDVIELEITDMKGNIIETLSYAISKDAAN